MHEVDLIVEEILQLSKKERHPDNVSCIHAVLMQVNMKTGKEMLKIRRLEKQNEIKSKKNRQLVYDE